MKLIYSIYLMLFSVALLSQTRVYSGSINNKPITLTTYCFSDNYTSALYIQGMYESPIKFEGHLSKKSLILIEQEHSISDTLNFINLALNKTSDFEYYDNNEFKNLELLQLESTEDHYFKLLVSKESGESPRVIGVKILEKRTDRLIQELSLNCEYSVLNNLSLGDFNFDGIQDFAVFEASYTGDNASNVYILRKPKSENYFISNYHGTSLDFDYKNKIIYERNSCCMGNQYSTAKYRVENDEMVLISKECYKYDPIKKDFVLVDCD
uniref:FG-GAP repeat protein n=1 Tax=Roseivirga sp. TaxID=1964215 RepID=UPI00404817C1